MGKRGMEKRKEAFFIYGEVFGPLDDCWYLRLRQFAELIVTDLVISMQLHQGFGRFIKGFSFLFAVDLVGKKEKEIII